MPRFQETEDLLQSVISVHVMALHFFDASLTGGTDTMNSFIFIYIDHLFRIIYESSSHCTSSSVHLPVCFRCPNNFVRKIFTLRNVTKCLGLKRVVYLERTLFLFILRKLKIGKNTDITWICDGDS